MRVSWLLRGRDWRRFHVHRCLKCKRQFCDDEPGSWTDNRSDEYPELCSLYTCGVSGRWRSHGDHCRSSGPYCPACAVQVADELIELRERYRDLARVTT